MKFTNLKTTRFFHLLILFSFFFISFFTDDAQAWSGYDFDKKTEIDIGQGNLVREGNVIQFYDTADDNFRTAKVVMMQSIANGTELTVLDLDSKKERVFVMY